MWILKTYWAIFVVFETWSHYAARVRVSAIFLLCQQVLGLQDGEQGLYRETTTRTQLSVLMKTMSSGIYLRTTWSSFTHKQEYSSWWKVYIYSYINIQLMLAIVMHLHNCVFYTCLWPAAQLWISGLWIWAPRGVPGNVGMNCCD